MESSLLLQADKTSSIPNAMVKDIIIFRKEILVVST